MIHRDFSDWIKKAFSFWKGRGQKFALEAKIFHVFSLIAIIAALLTFLLNLYTGLVSLAFISLSVFLIQSVLYYISRFKRKTQLAIFISGLEIHILLAINYFLNQGINGPTLLLYAVSLFFIIAVSNRQKLIYLFIGNSALVAALLLSEYLNPSLITGTYPSRLSYFVDTYFTYIITTSLIYAGTGYLLRSYVKQRKALTKKAIALEKTNHEKDKLFSVISHDLRTPLANVQQYLEMLTTVELDEHEKKIIENKLLDITRNAQELLTNLLQWSRNRMEGIHINLHPVNLKKEISPTVEHLQQIASKKGIILNLCINDDISVIADTDMLNLVIRNILYNAIKFTPFGGNIEFTSQEQNNRCLISIIDNGKGIPAEKQSRLFNVPTNSSLGTNNEKGTGIGLMLCKEYTFLQNGEIWFESEEGIGTAFYLSFPIVKKEEASVI